MVRGYGVFGCEGMKNELSPVGTLTKPGGGEMRAGMMGWKRHTFVKFEGRHGNTEKDQERESCDI